MTIGERIKEARKYRKMTQKQLAEAAEVATGTIQQYELGKREPRHEILVKISKALKISVAALCDTGLMPIEKLCPETLAAEIKQYFQFDEYINSLGYEIVDGYEYEGNQDCTLIVDRNRGRLYVLTGEQHKDVAIQSIESYTKFFLDELAAKGQEIEDFQGWLT